MKKTLIIILLFPILIACEKSPLKQLPKATQEGKNTIGCLINGVVYNTWNEEWRSITCFRTCQFYEGGMNGR